MTAEITVVVIGLGYVGLPLAVELAKHFDCTGVDVDRDRIDQLRAFHDRTAEISAEDLQASSLKLTADPSTCPPAHFYIVTVPTPVDADNVPDLRIVEAATVTVASLLDPEMKPVVVYESTVYPGVTEEICGPLLEKHSGLRCGEDFFLGYSPERINPGDREHVISKITKVVSGQNAEILDRVSDLYGAVTSGGVFRAASIKAAEAAKVIENAQRDINIAFMNEIARIFGQMDLSVWDVLAAARTKWNFLPFAPGLVGGHCIGVDPYYLSHRAKQLGYNPEVILAGRSINDAMALWCANSIDAIAEKRQSEILVLGLTFKEDVPDLRNSKVADLIGRLDDLGHRMTVHDPRADAAEAAEEYGITLADDACLNRDYDIVVLAVPHERYRELGYSSLARLVRSGGIFADLKGVCPEAARDDRITAWTL